MADYRTVDWTQDRPDSAQIEHGWHQSRIVAVEGLDQRLQAVVDCLGRTHANGGALAAQFRFDVAPAIEWFFTRNQLPEADFFTKFFQLDLVQTRLMAGSPIVSDDNHDLGFSLESPFVAVGRLAHIISNGGAYRHFEGPDAEIIKLVRDFTEAAFENRYSETRAYLSWKPWSRWFKDVAWDGSFFWLDMRTATATVLVVTDTD